MPYYLYQESVVTGVWECLERHHDFERRAEGALVTMVQGDTEVSARALLDIRLPKAGQLPIVTH